MVFVGFIGLLCFIIPTYVIIGKYSESSKDQQMFNFVDGMIKVSALFLALCTLFIFLLFPLDTPTLYPLSYLPIYHPLNTYPNSIGSYSLQPDDTRLIMKRRVLLGAPNNTIKTAKKQCKDSIPDLVNDYHCFVQACADSITDPTLRLLLSDGEKKELCDGSNPREYLYLLGYKEVFSGC